MPSISRTLKNSGTTNIGLEEDETYPTEEALNNGFEMQSKKYATSQNDVTLVSFTITPKEACNSSL